MNKICGDALCFHPEKTVSRGEFLAVLMNLLDAPLSDDAETLNDSAPQWLQPYLTAAMRSGFLEGFPTEDMNAPIGRNEAAVILQNVLDLPVEVEEDAPTFAEMALAAMSQNGLSLSQGETLTRAEMAELLYEVSRLAPTHLMVFGEM